MALSCQSRTNVATVILRVCLVVPREAGSSWRRLLDARDVALRDKHEGAIGVLVAATGGSVRAGVDVVVDERILFARGDI